MHGFAAEFNLSVTHGVVILLYTIKQSATNTVTLASMNRNDQTETIMIVTAVIGSLLAETVKGK